MDIGFILSAAGVPAAIVGDVLAVIGAFAAVMPYLPVPADATTTYGKVWTVMNWIARNVKNASNAKLPAPAPKV